MSRCIRCNGTRKLYSVSAKCSDRYWEKHINGKEHYGYVPEWIGGSGKGDEASGDYVEFVVCRHCGTIQGEWPALDETLNQFKYGKVKGQDYD